MTVYWYRVRITAVRVDLKRRVEEMITDVEATSSREAIEKAKRSERDTIDRCYQKSGRRFTAVKLGTTEQLANGGFLKSLTPRQQAAHERIDGAIEHLEAAREQLDAACRDLCSLVGSGTVWRSISNLSKSTREIRYGLVNLKLKPEVQLDSDPSSYENRHRGCGQDRR